VQTLLAPDPDILAVTELENDGYGPHSSIASLADALGSPWRFVSTPGQDGDDEIRTGLLYRGDRVRTIVEPERLISGPFASAGRPPLAQNFSRVDGETTGIRRMARAVTPAGERTKHKHWLNGPALIAKASIPPAP
jgi:predicted extracellular nuclease